VGRSCDRWAVATGERCARAAGTRRNGTGDRCARAVAAGLTGTRAGGRLAVLGPGWSGTGAWTSYAPHRRSPVQRVLLPAAPARRQHVPDEHAARSAVEPRRHDRGTRVAMARAFP
jgi:hypothetical protein